MSSKKFDDGVNFDYTVHVNRRDSRFFLQVHELNRILVADDLATGHAELEREIQTLINHYRALGKESEIPRPVEAVERDSLKKALTPFFIKASVVALVGAVLIATSHVAVLYALQEAPRKAGLKAGREVVRGVTKGLESFAKKEMTPEREERLHLAIRSAVARLQPFASDLTPLFEDAQTQSAVSQPAAVKMPGKNN
jgi:hypothetical protein